MARSKLPTFRVHVQGTRIIKAYSKQEAANSIKRCFEQWGYTITYLSIGMETDGKGPYKAKRVRATKGKK